MAPGAAQHALPPPPVAHDPGVGRLLTAADLADPREGKFNRPDDVLAIQPVLERIAVEYAEYENSGSTVWDTLIDVSARPQWLKDLAEQTIKKGRFGSFRRSSDVDRLVAGRRPQCVGHVGGDGVADVGVRRAAGRQTLAEEETPELEPRVGRRRGGSQRPQPEHLMMMMINETPRLKPQRNP